MNAPAQVTYEELNAKLEALKDALFDVALVLLRTTEDDPDAWESELLVDADDADEGLGLLAEAWEALEFGEHDAFIDEALKRGGYTTPTQGGTP